MGLLDEAIKEHLELKRRRGADPHEVALLQHEALGGAVDDAGHLGPGHQDRAGAQRSGHGRLDEPWHSTTQAGAAMQAAHPTAQAADAAANVNQETMEIDMSALLGADEEISAKRLEDRQIEARDARVSGEQLDEFAWEAPAPSAGRPRRFKDRHLEGQGQLADEGRQTSWM